MRIEYLSDHLSHCETVSNWHHAEFGYLNPSVTLAQRAERLRFLQKGSLPCYLIALSPEGKILGTAGIVATTLVHRHLTPWLSAVCVPAEYRGRGIASALSLRAVEETKSLGFTSLHLFTPHNESLYARIGWQTIDQVMHGSTALTVMARSVNIITDVATD